ncbi:hypothetical protein EDB84DRAFT_1572474 [Lactarius hengduanensis]|nr:hypothetical protein EDB84DRAFT_1572474 [Lactarius hengduanensis]KAH9010323.1 hypothetical protein EDB85DRAFT_1902194 [Lactarius pseudohatsudake]KAH9011305.1 hypothetical protein EDB85DRAFT_2160105 [Lactarius pseudohatsudake]KAH9023275.1 hypothetical protein EDB85DRAFT_1894836 [Lactarius pseudohatsudake]KAH9027965.1 hypothetical protein EDB85DRAFT_2148192 [Lactarius pseudohatsudake]
MTGARSRSRSRRLDSPHSHPSIHTHKMPYRMIRIVAAVVVLGYLGQYAIGPLEDQMRDQHVWIVIGLNVTIRMFWHGDILVERAIAPFQVVIPRDQVAPAA